MVALTLTNTLALFHALSYNPSSEGFRFGSHLERNMFQPRIIPAL